ncbi:MAG: hypothetical protein HZC26_03590 [Candidatus Magasanikbacteria bacterium]|nr:hypothetical protein [Candidatus Magasanikbacteria bacterium]
MSTIQDTLANAGFEPSVAKIYTILIENNELPVGEIIKRSELSRAGVYDALNLLLAQEFVEYRKECRNAFYRALHPNKLYGLIEQKKRDEALLEQEMNETIRALTGSYNLANNKPGVRFFEGEEGIREVTFNSLEAKDEILTYLDVEATQKYIAEMNKEYVAKRVEKNIKKRMIVPDTQATRERYKNYSPMLEVRLMPPNIKPFKTITQIYNKKVSFTTLNEQKKIGVIIEDEQISGLHRSIFEFVWNSLPPFQTEKSVTPPSSTPPTIVPLLSAPPQPAAAS